MSAFICTISPIFSSSKKFALSKGKHNIWRLFYCFSDKFAVKWSVWREKKEKSALESRFAKKNLDRQFLKKSKAFDLCYKIVYLTPPRHFELSLWRNNIRKNLNLQKLAVKKYFDWLLCLLVNEWPRRRVRMSFAAAMALFRIGSLTTDVYEATIAWLEQAVVKERQSRASKGRMGNQSA